MKKIWELYKKHEEIINYLIVGFRTTAVSFVAYFIVTRTFLDPNDAFQLQIANIIKWVVGVTFAYVTNRRYVFKSKRKDWINEFIMFTSSRVLTLFLDMGVMALLVTKLKINDLIANFISIVLVMIGNYVLSKLFVFRKKN